MEVISKKQAVRTGKHESSRIFKVYAKRKMMIKH